jgi:aminomethyltransferase
VPIGANKDCFVEMRGKLFPVQIIKLPFVRHGKQNFDIKEKV